MLIFVQVEFSVKDYRPEELSIKTEGDVLIVMGKHETKSEGGSSFISKQFEQKFSLPSGDDFTKAFLYKSFAQIFFVLTL
jgi:HSP20 family molecular chaperone IbpA